MSRQYHHVLLTGREADLRFAGGRASGPEFLRHGAGGSSTGRPEVCRWSLDILEGSTWVKGVRFYQAAAAWTMLW